MIDFTKIKITDETLINTVWNNDLLVYEGKSEKRFNDEIKELVTKSYKNLYFTKYQNRLEITGSIHYFFNNGVHNANDFNLSDCINTILELQDVFNLDLNKCFLINLEYGINVVPTISIKELINNLIYHEKRQFVRPTKFDYYRIAGKTTYKQIKAYNKGVQFPQHCDINTFRFEVKTKQAKFINKLGLYTLNDLTIVGNYDKLIASLVKEWNSVLLFENSNAIDPKFINSNFWETLITLEGNRNKFNIQKKSYYSKLGSDNLHSKIKNLIVAKTDKLKSVHILTIISLEIAQL